jgi:hypothetical protein
MLIEFVTDFEARTTSGVQLISAGRVLNLAEDKAARLIDAGVAKAAKTQPACNPLSLPYVDTSGRLVIPCDCPAKYRYWAGGQSIRETLKEIFEERAAIMQYDGGLTKDQAEKCAALITTKYYRTSVDESEMGG